MTQEFFKEGYMVPETSNYLKLSEGSHTFRILSSAITGYQYFNKDNKPIRSKDPFEETPSDIKKDGKVNHFWAFVIYNRDAEKIQVLELTQKSIMSPLKDLIDNPKWGSIFGYDITITRKGTGFNDTEYSVIPNPKEVLSEEITNLYNNTNINLDALYESKNPFGE